MMDGLRVVLKRLDPSLYKLPVKCDFCGDSSQDELLYGKIHTLDNINVHYYCLLFACNLRQNGGDDEGILGFLPNDIRTEIRRSQKEKCSYCLKPGATIICVQRMCKKVFHLPCGIRNGSIHHFFKIFQSFCKAHRPQQRVPQYQLMLPEAPTCAICLETVKRDPKSRNVIWAPCCKVNAWLHRACVQKLALHAGYFFKCPRCNNKPEFTKAMLSCGIYIPEKDASWELEPNAFEELTERYSYCDKEKCICPKGREYDVDDTEWEVILCEGCGSQGIHLGCLGAPPKSRRTWCCQVCSDILTHKEPAPSTSNTTESEPAGAVSTEVNLSVEDRRQGAQLKRAASEWVDTRYNTNDEAVAEVVHQGSDSLLPVQRGLQQQQQLQFEEQHQGTKRDRNRGDPSKEKENKEVDGRHNTNKSNVSRQQQQQQQRNRGGLRGDRCRSGGRRRRQQTTSGVNNKRRHIDSNYLFG